jgi:hypothetical protein
MTTYDPKAAPREVNPVVTTFVLLLVRTGLSERPYELERSYRERLRLLDCDEGYRERDGLWKGCRPDYPGTGRSGELRWGWRRYDGGHASLRGR